MICAFSLFTHLLQAETYIYMEDMNRVLKKGGKLVFSFLEFEIASHWPVFDLTVKGQKNSNVPYLNMFMETSVIINWAERLKYNVVEIINGDLECFEGKALGQSVAILEKK